MRAPKVEELQAPARRLARTIMILGPEEGTAFGLRAVTAIQAAAAASLGDPHCLLLWWANAVTLRWSFWALSQGGSGEGSGTGTSAISAAEDDMPSPGQNHFGWLMKSLGPALQHVEVQLFGDLVNLLWRSVVLATAMQSAEESRRANVLDTASTATAAAAATTSSGGGTISGAAAAAPAVSNSTSQPQQSSTTAAPISRTFSSGSSRSAVSVGPMGMDPWLEEGAVGHWIRGLRGVDGVLHPRGRPPFAPRPLASLLRKLALIGLMNKLDKTLFETLLTGDDQGQEGGGGGGGVGPMASSSPHNHHHYHQQQQHHGASVGGDGALPHELLPCQRGKLTFEAGVALKMAAGKLMEWASDAGMFHGTMYDPRGSGEKVPMLPRLREVADLLMVDKSSLTDEEGRRTIAPSLSTAAIVRVLQRYVPDDGNNDAIPSALIKQLKAEAVTEQSGGGGGIGSASPGSGGFGSIVAVAGDGYMLPSPEQLLEEGIIHPLVSLEMSADSDDELSVLEERGDQRYRLLRDVWSSVRM